jgi:transcriptional/translational regulatory protein YebC/TACO1
MGKSGSVSFQFTKLGVFKLNPEGIDQEELEFELIESGLEEMGEGIDDEDNEVLIVRCAFADFGNMQRAFEEREIEPISSELEWIPSNVVELDNEKAEEVLTLVAKLEEDEDVQKVFHNLA